MANGRASKKKILVVSNSMAGEVIDPAKKDGDVPVWDQSQGKYIHKAANDHDHDIGNVALLFENSLV